jgi:hypothetical protein
VHRRRNRVAHRSVISTRRFDAVNGRSSIGHGFRRRDYRTAHRFNTSTTPGDYFRASP